MGAPRGITYVFEHDHGPSVICSLEGERVTINPTIQGGAYVVPILRCIEAEADLRVVRVERY